MGTELYETLQKNMQKYIEVLRPKKWLLNLLILVPLFLSLDLLDTSLLKNVAIGFVLFCVAASASYSVNDIFDRNRDRDRDHAEKNLGTPPRGSIKPIFAVALAIVLALIALVGSFMLNAEFGLIILTYLVISLWLSAWLQHVPLVDVCLRMALAVLRIVAGAVLIQSVVPLFVVIVVALGVAAVFFGKQLHAVRNDSAIPPRYEASFLRGVFPFASALFVSSYVLLSLSAFVQDGPLGLTNNNLFYGNIFVLFIALAFMQNVYRKDKKSPLWDPRVVVAALAYLIFVYLFLYTFKG